MPDNNSETKTSKHIRIVTNVLTTALKLWLRSQVSQIQELELEIQASDRQILSGCVPSVSIFASHAVYQGIHLTKIQLLAENIRINIGSVLKGKPLKLLETVPVAGELMLEEKDLNASLSSALLSTALNDVLVKLVPEHSQNSKSTSWQKITLDNNQLVLSGTLTTENDLTSLEMGLSLELLTGQQLQLSQILIKQNQKALLENNHGHSIDLGSDVDIQELTLIPGKLECRGRINVNP
jgi:LmeA-like phospholipid-binding